MPRAKRFKQRLDCGTPPIPVIIDGQRYASMGEAARALNIHVSTIWKAYHRRADSALPRFNPNIERLAARMERPNE